MPDSPDYSKYNLQTQRVSLQDMGELAARLGAVSKLYRTGVTVFIDDFSCGLGHALYGQVGGNSLTSLIATNTLSNPYAALMLTDNVPGSSSFLYYELGHINTGKTGVEFSFRTSSYFGIVNFYCIVYDGTNKRIAQATLDQPNNKIKISIAGGVEQQLATFPTYIGVSTITHFLKLVFDVSTSMYVSLTLDDIVYSVSQYSLSSVVSATNPLIQAGVQNNYVSGQTPSLVLDYFILTQSEP